ncbi:MAG: BlaI/MecI/CopY family transcriptional regulator [Mycobacteriales bacterium]
MARAVRRRGGLEQEVLACLAVASGPQTPTQVQAALGGDLAYTTVMTTLARLHAKGVLVRSRAGRAYAYRFVGRPEHARSSLTAHHMLRLLDSDVDRAAVLSRFVADLAPGDEQLLSDLLRGEEGRSDPGRRA